MSEANDATKKYTVLFVDDETSILRSMKRIFHAKPFRMVLADSAEKALEFMKQNTVHVVISDMKMPGMNGPEFLREVAAHYPDTYRIVLSGFADLESTLKVINEGQIQRYLQKPWDNEVLVDAVERGVEFQRLKDENKRLQVLSVKQNKQLLNLNKSLEQKVEQRTLQIKTALTRAEQSNQSVKKVLYNMISVLPHIDGAFAKRVSNLAEALATRHGLDKKQVADIAYAALIHEIGFIATDEAVLSKPFSKLSPKQQVAFYDQLRTAQLILSPAPQLQSVSDAVVNQYEFFNGKGNLKGLSGEQIPIGAQILAVARDFLRYVTGRIDGNEYNESVALGKMGKFAGIQYDAALINILREDQAPKKDESAESVEEMEDPGLTSDEIEVGMVLKEALFNDSDILILPEGHVFDKASIDKLKDLEERFEMSFSMLIEEDTTPKKRRR